MRENGNENDMMTKTMEKQLQQTTRKKICKGKTEKNPTMFKFIDVNEILYRY